MPTDQERADAYEACVNAHDNNLLKQALPFISAVLSGNADAAVGGWADMVKAQMSNPADDCSSLLSDSQRQAISQHITDREGQGFLPGKPNNPGAK